MSSQNHNVHSGCTSHPSLSDELNEIIEKLKTLSSHSSLPASTTCNDLKTNVEHSVVKQYLNFLNSAPEEELVTLKGLGKRRVPHIMSIRAEEPFESLDDLQKIGLTEKQVDAMMKQFTSSLFE